jgi:hypothetical protein
MTPDTPALITWKWQDDITEDNVRRALPSLFSTGCEAHFLTAPRSQPHHRLSPNFFRIALARRLRLPVHTYRRRCKCKRWLDIFGDHYFDCHGVYPKTGLHNRIRDGLFHILQDIAMHTSVLAGPQDVLHEPTNVAPSFPSVRPGDIVIRLHNHKLQACAIDFSMVGPPKVATTASKQRKQQIGKHTECEIQKWKGTSKPRPRDGVTPDPTVHKHHVMADLRRQGISMIPATVGSWGDMGPMLFRAV